MSKEAEEGARSLLLNGLREQFENGYDELDLLCEGTTDQMARIIEDGTSTGSTPCFGAEVDLSSLQDQFRNEARFFRRFDDLAAYPIGA